jgi:hypothetical protein
MDFGVPAISRIEQFVDEAAFCLAQRLPKHVSPQPIHDDQLNGDILHCVALLRALFLSRVAAVPIRGQSQIFPRLGTPFNQVEPQYSTMAKTSRIFPFSNQLQPGWRFTRYRKRSPILGIKMASTFAVAGLTNL